MRRFSIDFKLTPIGDNKWLCDAYTPRPTNAAPAVFPKEFVTFEFYGPSTADAAQQAVMEFIAKGILGEGPVPDSKITPYDGPDLPGMKG